MMTFYQVEDIDRFFQVIDMCVGGIFFKTSENRYVDIRHNDLVKKLLGMSCGRYGVERLELCVECADDSTRLLRYMMESSRTKGQEKICGR